MRKTIKKYRATHLIDALRNTVRILISIAAISAASCSKDAVPETDPTEGVSYLMIMPDMIETHTRATEAGTANETWFNNMGIYYFENDNCVALDTWRNTNDAPFKTFPIKRAIPLGLVNKALTIYVAASTEDALPTINVGQSVSELFAAANNYKRGFAHTANLLYPTEAKNASGICIPMSGKVEHTFPTDGKVATVSLKRSVAKLRITVSNAMPTIGEYDATRMALRIVNAHTDTQIIPNTVATKTSLHYPWVGNTEPPQEIKDLPDYSWNANGFQKETAQSQWMHYCYLTPNNDPTANLTSLKLFLPYKFTIITPPPADYTDCTYDVPFNRPIEPNCIYELSIKVYGLGIPTRAGGNDGGNAPRIETSWNVTPWNE